MAPFAHSLHEAYPELAEVSGLLALLLLHDARRAARLDASGQPVRLPEQDRERWDHEAISAATQLLEHALARAAPGPFQTEAAIAAVHARARTAAQTDWREIAALYALLEGWRPTPAVRVNRAYAVARAHAAAEGLALLDRTCDIDANAYPYVFLVRGTLLGELGRVEEARHALELAELHARNQHERTQIRAQYDKLGEPR